MRHVVLVGLVLAGCAVRGLDLDGLPCPCDRQHTCDPFTNTCVAGRLDFSTGSEPPPPSDGAVTPTGDIALPPNDWVKNIVFSSGTLTPAFAVDTMVYTLLVPVDTVSLIATVTTAHDDYAISVNGTSAMSAKPSSPIDVHAGIVPITIRVSAGGESVSYAFTVTHAHYLKAPSVSNGNYGSSVALSGDTMVVGAPNIDEAYVYVQNGSTWTYQATLVPAVHVSGWAYMFGASVAIDGNTIVVGAPSEASKATGVNGNANDDSNGSCGAVYAFTRENGVWSQQAYMKSSVSVLGESLGATVAIVGDTIAASDPGDSSPSNVVSYGAKPAAAAMTGAAGAGAVIIFTRTGTTWVQAAYIKPPDPKSNGHFGEALAMNGNTIVSGTINNFSNNEVYAFAESSGVWSLQAEIGMSYDLDFGWSVAVYGDTMAVGAPGDYNDFAAGGGIYLYTRSGTTWTQTDHVMSPTGYLEDALGWTVALSGTMLAAAEVSPPYLYMQAVGDPSNATGIDGDATNEADIDAGGVYLYQLANGSLSEWHYVKSLDTHSKDAFGLGLAVSDDLLVAAAPYEMSTGIGVDGTNESPDGGTGNVGAVYVYPLK